MKLHLNELRRTIGRTQDEIASSTGIHQSTISIIENGLSDPGISTIQKYLDSLGYKLQIIPKGIPSLLDASVEIKKALKEGKEDLALRLILQTNDELAESNLEHCLLAVANAPIKISNTKFEALFFGVVEYQLTKKSLPLPNWLLLKTEKLAKPWTVDPWANDQDELHLRTPYSLRKRNIYFAESELTSV